MKKLISFTLCLALIAVSVLAFSSCKKEEIKIGIPNDPTNEARALIILQEQGLIRLREGAGITASIKDIESNPYNITFLEIEAAQLPGSLSDLDYAVINSNYAIGAGLSPKNDSVALEGAYSAYSNIIAVKSGNENTDKIKALKAAVESQQVADYIANTYGGEILSVVQNPGNGLDSSVDYAALSGAVIKVGASPAPHADILEIAKNILREKNITLEIVEFTDYVQPNNSVENNQLDANYFQHLPYLQDFNKGNSTNLVSVASIHVEPMGIYSKNHKSLDEIKK